MFVSIALRLAATQAPSPTWHFKTAREASMDDERWSPGACVLFAVVTSLALWTVVILVVSLIFG